MDDTPTAWRRDHRDRLARWRGCRVGEGAARRKDEAARLLRHLGANDRLVACDPAGRDHSSETLAKLIGDWRDQGVPRTCFAPELLERAELRLAFGTATWPHLLFRAMLAEQLYRAEMILKGHPYHRGDDIEGASLPPRRMTLVVMPVAMPVPTEHRGGSIYIAGTLRRDIIAGHIGSA